ncbi:MAG: hypothetical protein V7K25_23060 [Nostoc sp.]
MSNEEAGGNDRIITNRTYAKVHAVGAIHELPLPENQGLGYFLRKS